MATNNSNYDVVVSMDTFRGNEHNAIIVKRLAVHNLVTGGWSEFHFMPNRSWTTFDQVARRANWFSTTFIHGLKYESGHVPYFRLRTILMECTRNATRIFAKGVENTRFISNVIQRNVINVDQLANRLPLHVVRRIKERDPTAKCVMDHTRVHTTLGFAGPNYSCCVERASTWAELIRAYDQQQQEQQQQQDVSDIEIEFNDDESINSNVDNDDDDDDNDGENVDYYLWS